jgi:hypothetical protein
VYRRYNHVHLPDSPVEGYLHQVVGLCGIELGLHQAVGEIYFDYIYIFEIGVGKFCCSPQYARYWLVALVWVQQVRVTFLSNLNYL